LLEQFDDPCFGRIRVPNACASIHPAKPSPLKAASGIQANCSSYAIGFWGYLRNGKYTSQFWRHYFIENTATGPIDTFWFGPEEVFDKEPEKILNNEVTPELLRDYFGPQLQQYHIGRSTMLSLEKIILRNNITNEFIIKTANGDPIKTQYAARSLASISNLSNVTRLIQRYATTQCARPYSHILLTRMDLLQYFYPRLPNTTAPIVLYNEGEGLFRDSLRRIYGAAGSFDINYRYLPDGPHFNDQFIWIPWSLVPSVTRFQKSH
jgi:hypothetical protein